MKSNVEGSIAGGQVEHHGSPKQASVVVEAGFTGHVAKRQEQTVGCQGLSTRPSSVMSLVVYLTLAMLMKTLRGGKPTQSWISHVC